MENLEVDTLNFLFHEAPAALPSSLEHSHLPGCSTHLCQAGILEMSLVESYREFWMEETCRSDGTQRTQSDPSAKTFQGVPSCRNRVFVVEELSSERTLAGQMGSQAELSLVLGHELSLVELMLFINTYKCFCLKFLSSL